MKPSANDHRCQWTFALDSVLLGRWVDQRDAAAFREITARHADMVFANLESRFTASFDLDELPDLGVEDAARLGIDVASASGTKLGLAGEALPRFPDFKVWTLLTPLPGQSEQPIAIFCEVFIRWSEKGRARGVEYRTVLLRRLSQVDIPR